jgi:hypothetical protein
MVAPCSTAASAQIRPPCRWMMRCTIASPTPGAVILVGAVQPLEHPEELVRVAQFISICR